MKPIVLFSLLVIIAPLSGCSMWNKDWMKHLPWSSEARLAKSKYETPTRMVAIWTPDILSQTGKPPTRGFGGRLYFYNDRSQPIPVEGQLMVYAFDDKENEHIAGEPDRKFAFTPEQFTEHYSKSDLGASYSVWLPWDPVGGASEHISLVPIFTSSAGQIVTGKQAKATLPGRKHEELPSPDEPALSRIPPVASVQSVAHYEPSAAGTKQINWDTPTRLPAPAAPQAQIRTSSIPVTPNLQRQLSTSPPIPLTPTRPMMGEAPSANATMQNGPAINEIQSSSAAVPVWSQGQQLSTHFERLRSQAREVQGSRAATAGSRMSQFHAAPPFPQTPVSTQTLPIQGQGAAGRALGN